MSGLNIPVKYKKRENLSVGLEDHFGLSCGKNMEILKQYLKTWAT